TLNPERRTYNQTLLVPISYTHFGKSERVRIYAAIGNYGIFGFDEILHGYEDRTIQDDLQPTTWSYAIPIRITRAISPGTYAVYAKVMRITTGLGEIISEPQQNIIEVYEER
ncbi:unnamed protein product, partial [marine sediment metagenome]